MINIRQNLKRHLLAENDIHNHFLILFGHEFTKKTNKQANNAKQSLIFYLPYRALTQHYSIQRDNIILLHRALVKSNLDGSKSQNPDFHICCGLL